MKIRLVVSLVGLAIGFAVSVLAQENDTVVPQTRQEIEAIDAKLNEAINNNDPAAVATFFTEDAILMLPLENAAERSGIYSGRQAIKEWFAQNFTDYHPTESKGKFDELDGIDNGVWAVGKGTHTVNSRPVVVYRAIFFVPVEHSYKIRKMFVEF